MLAPLIRDPARPPAVRLEDALLTLCADDDVAVLLWQAVAVQAALIDDAQTPGISGEPRVVLVGRRNALLKALARFAFEVPQLRPCGGTTLAIANRILADMELFVLAIALDRCGWAEAEIDAALAERARVNLLLSRDRAGGAMTPARELA